MFYSRIFEKLARGPEAEAPARFDPASESPARRGHRSGRVRVQVDREATGTQVVGLYGDWFLSHSLDKKGLQQVSKGSHRMRQIGGGSVCFFFRVHGFGTTCVTLSVV